MRTLMRPEKAEEILKNLKLDDIPDGFSGDKCSHWEDYQTRYVVNLNGQYIIHPEKTRTNFLKKADSQSELEFLIKKAMRQNLDRVHDCAVIDRRI